MIFARKGPRYLFFHSLNPSILENFLINLSGGESTELSDALEKSGENDTIVFLPIDKTKRRVGSTERVIYVPHSPLVVISEMINNGLTDNIIRIDSGAGQIVMRIPEKANKVIEQIRERYHSEPVSLYEAIEKGTADETILSFTDKAIRNKIHSLDLIKENLLIKRPVEKLVQELRRDAVRYITHGLDIDEWYELRINIYDSRENYKLQYQRLSMVLSDLEAGFILGESWTRDHAIALLSVVAYQIRLFTFLSPEEIKGILLSLEYDSEGNRLVDYDLYFKNRKINWHRAAGEWENIDRVSLSLEMREKLLSNLSAETLENLKIIEKKLRSNIDSK
ncbi:MAG: hypothetical protein GX175_09770 [Halanaerobiaceae bacterium]|jgi:hypothetical protein|nr:hypothetical protein [Halanaerobiaceae bacterium]